jgi:hypothetical protein
LILLYIFCITTCFGPYGPFSGDYNIFITFVFKHVVIQKIYNNINKELLVAIAICLKYSYVYITQQDAPHKDKIPYEVSSL